MPLPHKNPRAEWLTSHIQRIAPEVHLARLDQYLEGDGSVWDGLDRSRVDEDVEARLLHLLQRQPDPSLIAQLETISRVVRSESPDLQDIPPLIRRWNELWAGVTNHGQVVGPSLGRVNLSRLPLQGIDLRNADLGRSDEGHEPIHSYVILRQALATGSFFGGSDLTGADFTDARLESTSFVGARLRAARLSGANLSGCDLRNADLRECDFSSAVLEGADFTGANVHRAIFDGADLLGVRGLLVDENSVHRARFSTRAGPVWLLVHAMAAVQLWISKRLRLVPAYMTLPRTHGPDAWSTLRRTYTGPSYIITLLVLFAFFAPRAAHAYLLHEVAELEGVALGWFGYELGTRDQTVPSSQEVDDANARLSMVYSDLARETAALQRDLQFIDTVITRAAPDCVDDRLAKASMAARTLNSVAGELGSAAKDLRSSALEGQPPDLRRRSYAIAQFRRQASDYLRTSRSASAELTQALGEVPTDCFAGAASEVRTAALSVSERARRSRANLENAEADLTVLVTYQIYSNTFPVWVLVLGLDSKGTAWPAVLLVLTVYNVLRGVITLSVGPLRDAEDRSHITPALVEYRWLLPLHRLVSLLLFLSTAVAAYNLWDLFRTPVVRFW